MPEQAQQKKAYFGLLRPRQCLVPTWRGWFLLVLMCFGLAVLAIREAYSFLALNRPVSEEVLVVEGWAPDDALKFTIEEFNRGHYQHIYLTGGPIEQGAPLFQYKTYAELGAASLIKLGLSTNVVQPVPAPFVRQDRTYTSAIVLRRWMAEHHVLPRTINLITVGPHARRSHLLFAKVFGEDCTVGVFAVPEQDYDPERWWHSSAGVRSVLSEVFAYGYVRLFFIAPKNPIPAG